MNTYSPQDQLSWGFLLINTNMIAIITTHENKPYFRVKVIENI